MKGLKILSYNMLFHNSFDVKEPIHVDFYVNTSENSPKILFSLSVKRSTETKKWKCQLVYWKTTWSWYFHSHTCYFSTTIMLDLWLRESTNAWYIVADWENKLMHLGRTWACIECSVRNHVWEMHNLLRCANCKPKLKCTRETAKQLCFS